MPIKRNNLTEESANRELVFKAWTVRDKDLRSNQ